MPGTIPASYQLRPATDEDAQAIGEASELADRLGELIVHELTGRQREVRASPPIQESQAWSDAAQAANRSNDI